MHTSSAPFNTLNYSDDFANVEATLERASLSFDTLGSLLTELGLTESVDKAVRPCQILTYLGVQFDSNKLEMSINESKCCEIKFELQKWSRKTVATKTELQSQILNIPRLISTSSLHDIEYPN